MKYKKVLVTGGAGFIGSHIVERLLKEGCHVKVIDDLSEGKWSNIPSHPKLKKHTMSILDNIDSVVKGTEVIFHLAALPRLQRSVDDPENTHRVNIDGTHNLLLCARKYKVKRFIFSSSSSVYGNANKTPFTETMPPDPLVPYSLHKVVGEQYCKLFSSLWDIGTISLRYFNVYGPRMNPDSPYANLVPKFMKLMSCDQIPTINGDGTHSRDFTYVSDIVEANILSADSELTGEIFNIGYGSSLTVNAVMKSLNKVLKKKIRPNYGPGVIEPRKTLASNTKAKRLLKWKPTVSFEQGLKKML